MLTMLITNLVLFSIITAQFVNLLDTLSALELREEDSLIEGKTCALEVTAG